MNRVIPVFLAALCALFFLGACTKPVALTKRPGLGSRIAFDYFPLTDGDFDYLSRFDVVVTHDIANARSVARLKRAGAKLFFYEWLPALYYTKSPGPWERRVYEQRRQWTLDPEDDAPDPMGAKFGCKDYFYDMADKELLAQRVEQLAHKAKSGGYDGIFFDWGSGWYALRENGYRFATEAFERRHPGVSYDDGVSDFLGRLRAKGLYIALNGAFRSDNAQLEQQADLDIVESMFTSDECRNPFEALVAGEGIGTVCETSFTPLSRALELANRLSGKARAMNPKVRFMFLDYARPLYRQAGSDVSGKKIFAREADRQALYYALALSYLADASGFTCGPDVNLPERLDDIFFQDLGAPLGPATAPDRDSRLRRFTKGFVVVSAHRTGLEAEVPARVRGVRDPYSNKTIAVSGNRVQLELIPEDYPSRVEHPIGRIYLYEY
jgi:hypothetical protein